MPNIVSNTAVDSVRTAQFNGMPIRIISADSALWFVASDVMKCLGVQNTTTSVQNLRADETRLVSILGSRPINALSEPGLRKRLMRSKKPKAQDLLNWIEREAIPKCRDVEKQSTPDAVQRLRACLKIREIRRQMAV